MQTNDNMAIDAERKVIEVDLPNWELSIQCLQLYSAQDGNDAVRLLPLEISVSGKVKKQCAHYFGVTINEQQAKLGIVVRVTSFGRNRFKLLYFEQDANNAGYCLASQIVRNCCSGGRLHKLFGICTRLSLRIRR